MSTEITLEIIEQEQSEDSPKIFHVVCHTCEDEKRQGVGICGTKLKNPGVDIFFPSPEDQCVVCVDIISEEPDFCPSGHSYF